MFIPVGKLEQQFINLIDKDLNGKVTFQNVLNVRYGFLTSIEDQLNRK